VGKHTGEPTRVVSSTRLKLSERRGDNLTNVQIEPYIQVRFDDGVAGPGVVNTLGVWAVHGTVARTVHRENDDALAVLHYVKEIVVCHSGCP
jgi:hypothetical protein